MLTQQINSLRKSLDLPPVAGRKRLAADVLGYYPLSFRATLSVGSQQGVKKDMAVVSADGLVGLVQTVEATSCQVILVTSRSVKIGARVAREGAQNGILQAETPQSLVIDFLSLDSQAQVGDLVVTSGLGGVIPGGIAVGRVYRIEDNPDYGARRVRVVPSVKMGSLREVFVLQ